MSELLPHKCIKCAKPYKDHDEEDYYCKTCLKEKQGIAEQLDKKFANRPSKKQAPSFEERVKDRPNVYGVTIID